MALSIFLVLSTTLVWPSDYAVPSGYYRGPCGELYSDKFIEKSIDYDGKKQSYVKHWVQLHHLNLLLDFGPQNYGFYLVGPIPGKYERFLFWKCNCHGQDMGYSFNKRMPGDDTSIGLFLLEGQSSEWSWSKNLTPEKRFIRKERLERNQIYAKEFSFSLNDGRDVVWAEQAAAENVVQREKSWSFNYSLIPKEFREGFFCLKPSIDEIKFDLIDLKR